MNKLIKVTNSKYTDYEELIDQRDTLLKEAMQNNVKFDQLFGDDMIKLFELQIEAIKYKKLIRYCTQLENSNQPIIFSELQEFINLSIQSYYDELEQIISDIDFAKEFTISSPEETKAVKRIYFRIAKLIHPDRRPDLADDETIKEFWNRTAFAYKLNDKKSLIELEVAINKYLKDQNIDTADIEIENIDQKIHDLEIEIEHILNTEPYTYKYILEDEEKIKELKDDYQLKIKEYKVYIKELKNEYSKFKIQGIYS
ncbi:MAG: hypothetical protein WBH77_08830 [Saccharofermentanales bacterium]